MNQQEFAEKIKQKYPQYRDEDDAVLTKKILEKYPSYRNVVDIDTEEPQEDMVGGSLANVPVVNPVIGNIKGGVELAKGVAKSLGQTLKGLGSIGQEIAQQTAGRILGAFSGKSPQEYGADIYDPQSKEAQKLQEVLEPQGGYQQIGKFAGDVAQIVAPQLALNKLAGFSQLPKATQTILRMVTTGSAIGAQESAEADSPVEEIATGVIAEAAIPAIGGAVSKFARGSTKVIKGISERLLRGLGAPVDDIITNPQLADDLLKQYSNMSDDQLTGVLENNAKTIVNGIRDFRRGLRSEFGQALQTLKSTDIDDKAFRRSIQGFLDDYGISSSGKERLFDKVEFTSPTLLNKASGLIDDLAKVQDGKSAWNVLQKIQGSMYKTPKTPEAQAFNSFLKDLDNSLSKAVGVSTDLLKEMNAKYSSGMQLSETVEDLFGKVKFSNLKEINKVTNRLKTALNKSPYSQQQIDDFLNKIGVNPSEFRLSEGIRGAVQEPTKTEAAGFSIGEIKREVSAGIISPETATNLAVKLEKAPRPFLTNLFDTIRNASEVEKDAIIRGLVDMFGAD